MSLPFSRRLNGTKMCTITTTFHINRYDLIGAVMDILNREGSYVPCGAAGDFNVYQWDNVKVTKKIIEAELRQTFYLRGADAYEYVDERVACSGPMREDAEQIIDKLYTKELTW